MKGTTARGTPVYCAYDELVDVEALVPNPRNPNRHPDEQVELLAKIIAHQGWRVPITVSRRSGFIVRGHARLLAARKLGETNVPVDYQDYETEAAEWADLIADNRIAELADVDETLLKDLIQEIDTGELDLELTGYREEELERLLTAVGTGAGTVREEDDEPAPDPPAEPVTRPGDLWILGRHRLLCGDATNPDHVRTLLAGARPALMVTDPPYGVKYDPGWRNEAADKGLIAFAASREGEVPNDDRADWYEAWTLFPGDVVYCWHAGRHASVVQASLERAGFEIRAQIIWAKPRLVISRGHYHWQHEPCWYAVRKGASAHWIGDRSQTTLWEIPMLDDEDQKVHSTQKPTECMARPIRNHEGDVYDPFVGTGTTIVAAERLGRRCYAMEIDPRYCDVAVARWERLTGRKAERIPAEEVGGAA